ncbi:hypothetical protein [Aeromicrobium sp. UC242_57]|uniref:hypothetical protein n=1 Tax=Aeromicrobium sp. UC242_57 TaxID=3374624 RepID=UPI0037B1E106
MIVESTADDVLYTPWTTGVPGNYLKPSMRRVGLDPENLPEPDEAVNFTTESRPKAWKDIWSAGQGVGSIRDVVNVAELIPRMRAEFDTARERAAGRVSSLVGAAQ